MKNTFIAVALVALLASCSKSLKGTEWLDESTDITIEFITDSDAKMKFGNESVTMTYKYDHPDITLSASRSADMVGNINGNKMTFEKDEAIFIKIGNAALQSKKDESAPELAPLALKEGMYGTTYINRNLFSCNEKREYIDIRPDIEYGEKGIFLIVQSSIPEGGYGTTLTLNFNNAQIITLQSTSGTNKDESISYYDIEKEHVNILQSLKLTSICIKHGANTLCCTVDKNMNGYFIEYFKISEVSKILHKM